jgi:ubiquinone/menaquinone biosynthesis C-methylase UbiE
MQLQPDQEPGRWDDHVSVYEAVFEPLTMQWARTAIASLGVAAGQRVLDVAAGSGGAALEMAARGANVTAIDASPRMVQRISARAASRGTPIISHLMDGQVLTFADASFDAALSVLGVILFPDAVRGLAEMRRVVRPGGAVALVTWTEPEQYALAAALRSAIAAVCSEQLPQPLPAQLRYREAADFRALFASAGFAEPRIEKATAHLEAASARWLAERVAFAPGMAAMVAGLGNRRAAVLDRFAATLESDQGFGPIRLKAVAFVGTARVSAEVC